MTIVFACLASKTPVFLPLSQNFALGVTYDTSLTHLKKVIPCLFESNGLTALDFCALSEI